MGRLARVLSLLLICSLSGAAAGLFQFWLFLHQPGSTKAAIKLVDIDPGMHFQAITEKLASEGIISNRNLFPALCKWRKADGLLQAGEYEFHTLSTPQQVLSRLINGEVAVHRVTIPEGATIRDVAELLEQAGIGKKSEIIRLAGDQTFIRACGLQFDSLEGYLYPDTYHFLKSDKPAQLLKRMVDQFRRKVKIEWQQQAEELGFTFHQVVILASMVEKEAKVESERPIIAAVFLNRLKRHMKLQSDPTAVYDLADFTGPLSAEQLKRDSPYNTYKHFGLPKGPICNPGTPSIKAVLSARDVPFLYFVSNRDGTHSFSKTFREHKQAINRNRSRMRSGKPVE